MSKFHDLVMHLSIKQLSILFFVVCAILYGNTLNHNYALDDAIVITKNQFTQQGLKGIPYILKYDSFTGFFGIEKKLVEGGRYRPLSIITFAIENSLWGNQPLAGHLINIIIYALIAILITKTILLLLSNTIDASQLKFLALIASVLFILHPIHTEVVANIKGRDELLSLLFSLLAFNAILIYTENSKWHQIMLAGIYLFLGLMSKENAISFVAIIPIGLIFFKNINRKKITITISTLLVASLVFIFIRHKVLGGFHSGVAAELMNNPFVDATASEKFATILFTWLIYFKLILFPHPLTYDYYPYHIPLVDFTNHWVIISIVLLALILIIGIKGLKKKNLIGFCILSFMASFSIVSNLLFPVGTFMNERFVFMPSVFWCIAASYVGTKIIAKRHRFTKIIIYIIGVYAIGFYSIKTIARNRVWKNDFTLFTTDVKTSFNSAKSNCSAGGKLWEEAKKTGNEALKKQHFALSEKYLNKAIEIHPNYVDAWLLLGNVLFDYKNDINHSIQCYLEVLKNQPNNENALKNADIILQSTDNRNIQLKYYKALQTQNPNTYQVNYRLGVLYGRFFNNLDTGIKHLKKAHKLNPNNVDALKDLGTAFGIKGDSQQAYKYSKMALDIKNDDYQIYVNLGIAASQLGKKAEADQYFKEAEKYKK